MLGGKVAVVCGFGEVGKGCAQALRGQGCRVVVTEIDPICALQAAMEGYEVNTLENMVERADLFITATGNLNIITADHMARMKDKAIIGNIGHFDNEIDMAGLKKVQGIERINIKPQYDEWRFAEAPRRGGRPAAPRTPGRESDEAHEGTGRLHRRPSRAHGTVASMSRRSLLERIIDERTGQSMVGTVSIAVARLADEFAREAMADEEFRGSIREMVRANSKALWASLQK